MTASPGGQQGLEGDYLLAGGRSKERAVALSKQVDACEGTGQDGGLDLFAPTPAPERSSLQW